MLLGGNHWAAIERRLLRAMIRRTAQRDARDDRNQPSSQGAGRGHLAQPLQWLSPTEILVGFSSAIRSTLAESGIEVDKHPSAARFVLMFAGRPGWILDWPDAERTYLLQRVMTSPVLLRAARLAVLGTRILNDVESIERSF